MSERYDGLKVHLPSERASTSGAIGVLTAILEARTGQQLAANREWRIETELTALMREHGLATLDALALAAQRAPALAEQVADALLNHESSFFRDAPVLDLVAKAAVAMQGEHPARRLRVWSAGCSFGQEPLSLAMLFAEQAAFRGATMPEIVATDVSEAALARARSGRYSQFEIQRGLPIRRMVEWFDSDGGDWVAKPDLVRRIAFRRMNLVAHPMPSGRFDVILCRNVLLYLTAEDRRQILDRFATVLQPGGVLVLGAGETVIGQTEAFRPSAAYRGLYERDVPGEG
ncbi:CheR family methyltransferase [Sphingomonas glacialis]|uniref:Protein-glutamate O-methyltransferase CheR n=1 Tax=Sphingomonas glacialis TaxID=658225 RepID=A0A502FI06_9SPHN|nr:protein-glutamate O-methyltransferase CheR [Sphingomonas glacialis]TPG49100.1 protein-glutamate O-methyltransferase CheR [Sphingomonas glacialis]